MSRQSSKLPCTCSSSALCAIAWLSLPMAILPSGTSTAAVMPACVAYAAADADVLPVEAQMTAFAPCSTAFEMAIVIPRSLKEPVGFMPSYLTHTFAPVRAESAGAGISGVPPSPSVTIGVASVMFSRSAYSRRTPRHCWAIRLLLLVLLVRQLLARRLFLHRREPSGPLHPQDGRHRGDHVALRDGGDGGEIGRG